MLGGQGEKPAAIVIPADFTKIDAGQPRHSNVGDPAQEEAAGIVAGIVEQARRAGHAAEIRYGIHQVLLDGGMRAPPSSRGREAQTMGVIWTQVQQLRQNPVIAVVASLRRRSGGGAGADELVHHGFASFAFFLLPPWANDPQGEGTGLLRRLLAPPCLGRVIAGLILAYILVFLQVIFLFGVGKLAFDISFGPSLLGLFLITLVTALASASLGLLVGAVAKSRSGPTAWA